MSTKPPDDFEALRLIVDALTPFDPKDQERIVRWASEKIGLTPTQSAAATQTLLQSGSHPSSPPSSGEAIRPKDIRIFVGTKNPQSDNQFAATVAYFYRFEAPEAERKPDIAADDLQDAARKAGRERLRHPAQTLLNAHGQGYFDKVERGRYALSTVGENLVAMALPQGQSNSSRRPSKGKRRPGSKKKK
jgi:hypothetical protein